MMKEIEGLKDVVVYLLDYHERKFLYISRSLRFMLGYPPDDFYQKGLDYLFELMHPEDYPRVLHEFAHILGKLKEKSQDQENLPVICQEFRVKNSEGCWLWLENTGVILDLVENSGPKTSLGFFKKIKNKQHKYEDQHSAAIRKILFKARPPKGISMLTAVRGSFSDRDFLETFAAPLLELGRLDGDDQVSVSEREKEVLQLIADGFSAKEIAGQLFVSETTVISHRKNLINKFKVKNTAELIKKASKLFWLE